MKSVGTEAEIKFKFVKRVHARERTRPNRQFTRAVCNRRLETKLLEKRRNFGHVVFASAS